MTKRKIFVITFLSALFIASLILVSAFGLDNQNEFNISTAIEDKNACIIVKYTSDMQDSLTFDGIKARQQLATNMELIELNEPVYMTRIIEGLEEMAGIEYAQPNYLLKSDEIASEDLYPQQWALKNYSEENVIDVNAEAAWEVEEGSGSVTVGILDTGIDEEHSDIKRAVKNNGYNFIDDNHEMGDPLSDKHGTAIAGIIAAQDNDQGIRGIANDVKITPLKFMDRYKGYTSDAIRAIQYAAQENIEIINCSFGSEEYNPALKEIMQNNNNILFVCAAGNDGKNIDQEPYYPASFDLPNIISVGSINSEGAISSFSNYGQTVDVLAPGENIYSTIPEEKYYSFSGTSMSAAYVTGVAALMKSQDNDISPAEVVNRINSTVRKYPDYDGKSGAGGIIDAYAALTNETAPMSETPLLEESSSDTAALNSEEAGTNAVGLEEAALAVNTAAEIEPIIAQQLHYGESGVNPASGNFHFP